MKANIRIYFFLCLVVAQQSVSQNRYTDSLYHVVTNPQTGNGERVMTLSDLANIVRYDDQPEALKLAEQAVKLAHREKDALYKVYAYESRSAVYLIMRKPEMAHKDTDSSLYYANLTNDVKAKSWAWYRKGRELDFESRHKEAVEAALKALQFIKEKGYWKEEASIYYALYGVFSTWEDLDNESKYALLALDAAKKSKEPNNLCESWQAVGSAAADRYGKTKDRSLIDSALTANKKAIAIYLSHEPYMLMTQLISIPAINTANTYNCHFPPSREITDSIRRYVAIALGYALKGKDERLQALSYGILNEDAKRNGDYALAETYLTQALSLMLANPNPDYYVRSSIYRELSGLAERRKDYPKALQYQKAYFADYKKTFDIEQNNSGKELEARYHAKEKEQQINFLTESEALHKKQKYLYTGIAGALLLGLLFMFRSYHFRLRYSVQREALLKQEKEEARLQARLKEEEVLLMEAQKEKAELAARLKEEETARLYAEQQVIITKNDMLQKEILASNLHVEQKNKVLQDLKKRLDENPGQEIKTTELNKVLKQQSHFDKDFEELKTELREIHPEFYQRLQEKAGEKLTTLDLKYCAYIYLKRSNLEMANLLGIESKSIRMSKYRLKQKLGLGKEDDLYSYISRVV